MAKKRRLKLLFEMAMLLGIASLSVAVFAPPPTKAPSGNIAQTTSSVSTQANLTLQHPLKHFEMPKPQGQAPLPLAQRDFVVTVMEQNSIAPGFTLVPVTGTASVVLISTDGSILHKWDVDASRARLLPNGNLLVIHGSKWGLDVEPWKSIRPQVTEYTWDGEVVWTHKVPDIAHHDVQRLDNGNTLFPYRVIVPAKDKTSIIDRNRRLSKIRSDSIIEVRPDGTIAWEWEAHTHLNLNECGKHACPSFKGSNAKKRSTDWTHINTTTLIPENRWYDQGDTRFKPGNIMTLPRNWWTVLLIDKESKKEVWRYTGDYKGGLSGGHEAHMIEKGLPGAGNILVFDNGRQHHQGESYVLEINPQTKELVWIYDDGKRFFSKSAGSMQRLKNGNTLISEDVAGRLFEVTPSKEVVWEVKTPFRLSRSRKYSETHCPQFAQFVQ